MTSPPPKTLINQLKKEKSVEKPLLIICAIRLNFRQLGAFITSASTPLTEQKYTYPPLPNEK